MLFEIKNLTVTLKSEKRKIVDGASLEVKSGDSVVIIGQSGSGKTMICRAVFGLTDLSKFEVNGKIIFNGNDILKMQSKQRRNIFGKEIAFIPQNPMTAFDPSVKIGSQLCETYRLHNRFDKRQAFAAITAALKMAGLDDPEKVCRSYPHMLSGGMLQRTAIAAAIMNSPRLIIADEPTTAIDAEHRIAVTDTIASLKESGAAIIMITHDFFSAQRLGGYSYVMKDGTFTEQGEIFMLMNEPKDEYTKELIASALI